MEDEHETYEVYIEGLEEKPFAEFRTKPHPEEEKLIKANF